tara:strand:- start:103 stop:402 length:300 start_codon:yes stop_codon:yes gene_type:complete
MNSPNKTYEEYIKRLENCFKKLKEKSIEQDKQIAKLEAEVKALLNAMHYQRLKKAKCTVCGHVEDTPPVTPQSQPLDEERGCSFSRSGNNEQENISDMI